MNKPSPLVAECYSHMQDRIWLIRRELLKDTEGSEDYRKGVEAGIAACIAAINEPLRKRE